MKKLFLLLFVLALPLLASAQIRFGYFSYDTVLKSMPDYLMAQRNIDDLRQKYDNEMKRSEQEFNPSMKNFSMHSATSCPPFSASARLRYRK